MDAKIGSIYCSVRAVRIFSTASLHLRNSATVKFFSSYINLLKIKYIYFLRILVFFIISTYKYNFIIINIFSALRTCTLSLLNNLFNANLAKTNMIARSYQYIYLISEANCTKFIHIILFFLN